MVITYRMRSSDLKIVESINGKNWKRSSVKFLMAVEVAKLFKSYKALPLIKDEKDSRFLKGGFSRRKPIGSRINFLPNGEKLNKAYSLFAEGLHVHDESSNSHWDVIFMNPNSSYSYLYTLDKVNLSNKAKYKRVEEFSKVFPKLKANLNKAIGKEDIVLAMLILLKTKMRVGNEIYYLKSRHKGLTTLKKKNVKISGRKIKFRYIGKGGVPMEKEDLFSDPFISAFKKLLAKKKANDFIFVNSKGHPMKDLVFESAFLKYCGKKFYPHIVRSEYATRKTKEFLNGRKKINKEEIKRFYLKIAHNLGHKKFSKKKGEWEDSYVVTLHHYVSPDLAVRVEKASV